MTKVAYTKSFFQRLCAFSMEHYQTTKQLGFVRRDITAKMRVRCEA